MIAQELIADALAAEMLAGVWTRQGLQSRARKMLGARSGKALRRLISDVMEQSQTGYPPSPDRLVACLLSSSAFGQATALIRKRRRPPATVLAPARFNPSPAFAGLDVPRLATPSELAAWLEVNVSQLDWLADAKKQNARATDPRIHHYVYALIPRRSGGLRLIESPKPRLKAIQRRILHEILEKAPVHERACGFVSGRSCRDGAQLHASEFVVAATDLKEFFPSTPLMRVHALFRRFGYPWAVARLLTGLCSTTTPPHALARAAGIGEDWGARRLYAAPHLPQGAPTSPALANLSAWRLDRRLSGLSRVFDANYSRYADDLAFSGDEGFAGKIGRFLALVAQIVGEEGLR